MAKATLLLGSNRGNRTMIVEQAIREIRQKAGKVSAFSSLYESEPWGFDDNIPFINQVVVIETALSPKHLLSSLLSIENELGRVRKNSGVYSPRPIDLDILFYDDLIVNETDLQIPHPRMQNRMFTLMPLMEISPDFIHPVLKKPVSELKDQCPDQLRVDRLSETKLESKVTADEI
ncbi:MAG: 2-amino-4-hydroxy-6-hydroxymethyldihydropteridine diphosphokinase [Bacteroidota bacterium]